MTKKYFKLTIFLSVLIGLLSSCDNSVSYKDGGKIDPNDAKEIMMLINIDKGDTVKYHIQDSMRRSSKDSLSKEISSFEYEKSHLSQYFKTNGGIVKDAKTAAEIAYIYLKDFYGEKEAKGGLPLIVNSISDYWFIEWGESNLIPHNGGDASILIRKSDGEVVDFRHGK